MPRSFLLPSVGSPKILPTVEQKYSELFSEEIFRDFQKISLKEYFFFFTFIDFQSITSHCKATSVFNIGFTPPLFFINSIICSILSSLSSSPLKDHQNTFQSVFTNSFQKYKLLSNITIEKSQKHIVTKIAIPRLGTWVLSNMFCRLSLCNRGQ